MNCKDAILELSNYIDGDIDIVIRRDFEQHLEMCADCAILVTQTRITIEIFARGETFDVPADMRLRLHEVLRRRMDSTGI